MLFDFKAFIEELRENPEKKEVVEKYEKLLWPIEGDTKDQIWFKEYSCEFETVEYLVPEELQEDFDWKLLMQLVASSLSSDWFLSYRSEKEWEDKDLDAAKITENQKPEFTISVQSGDQVVVKKVSELWGFQISRLYEIYIEEQMNLQVLMMEDEKEKDAIISQREAKKNRWTLVIENLKKEKLEQIEKEEKEEKLDDLMSQL